MKLSKQEFLEQPRRAITFIGMSGVGKSHLSLQLEDWGWHNYSCDYLIGTKYLGAQLEGAVSADNILNLSEFVGQIGSPDKGGVGLDEFARRQKMYYEAECAVLRDMPEALGGVAGDFVNDSSGSLCEIEEAAILDAVGQQTLFIYLRVPSSQHSKILERALEYPKPLFFPKAFFDEHLAAFQKEFSVERVEEIDSLEFLRWVFPYLFEARLPKYQALADKYGVTISTDTFDGVSLEEDFINIIAKALD